MQENTRGGSAVLVYLAALETEAERDRFQALYERYRGLMFHRAMLLLRNESDAEDAVHQAFLAILEHFGAVDKVSLRSAPPTKKDAHWRHPACFIIRFRFNAVADKRQWSSAASKPRRKTRAKLCSRFCAENEPSHQTCRSFSASRYSGLERRSRLRCRSAAK